MTFDFQEIFVMIIVQRKREKYGFSILKVGYNWKYLDSSGSKKYFIPVSNSGNEQETIQNFDAKIQADN